MLRLALGMTGGLTACGLVACVLWAYAFTANAAGDREGRMLVERTKAAIASHSVTK